MQQYPSTRLRRNRKVEWSRKLFRENTLQTDDLILPIFVQEGNGLKTPIESMPGVYRVTQDIAKEIAHDAKSIGINAVILFPYIDKSKKCPQGKEALNHDNLICRTIKEIKSSIPELGVITDVALDPYTSHGHDGLIDESGYVLNDKTIDVLSAQALNFALAGCDAIAPSDMMDGRVGKIRETLEMKGFHNTQIISYSAKYASNFYGPFRDAVGSKNTLLKADKKIYQMDCANSKEAMSAIELDIAQGADAIIIKPGLPYLDILKLASDQFNIPLVAYQVSGEYSMLKLAAERGIFDFLGTCFETLTAMKRAGASAIITYAALDIAKYLMQKR
ncbi:porphobilinogen synthase [Candidatus Lariskella endosymbiont of Hedychridium roseum]|uniref:porphobilinogen synthase n=1 Tax=Candidatus Lariskella endosymbiont of Hedychridium roseum TaxID=3077949 RepID=UPI0030CE0174